MAKTYTHNGFTGTYAQWADRLGLAYMTIYRRLKKFPLAEALTPGKRKRGGTKAINIVGLRFGKLVVIERAGSSQNEASLWRVRCDCGKELVRSRLYMVHHMTRTAVSEASCGCANKNGSRTRMKYRPGIKFGKLTLLEKLSASSWRVRCNCGEEFSTSIYGRGRRACRKCSGTLLTHDGITLSRNDWAKKLGITRQALSVRLQRHPVGVAVSQSHLPQGKKLDTAA